MLASAPSVALALFDERFYFLREHVASPYIVREGNVHHQVGQRLRRQLIGEVFGDDIECLRRREVSRRIVPVRDRVDAPIIEARCVEAGV